MLLYLCYFFVFLYIYKLDLNSSFADFIIKSTLLFSTVIVLLVEVLSLFNSLNFISIFSFWLLFFIILSYLLIKKKVFLTIKGKILNLNKKISIIDKVLIAIIITGVLAILFQGIIYPTNNWDSLTYHMSRIMYWLSNESVGHFQTHILRHLYQPPFAEYFILNINVLNGNDYLSNSVELFFLVNILVVIYEILTKLKINLTNKLISILFALTIPSVLLQASTTKNDIVVAFFILTSLLYCYNCYRNITLKNFLILGLSIGIAILSKGTSYVYLLPVLIVFSFFMLKQLIETKNFKIIKFGFLLISVVLLINISHYYRNYKINHSVLNIDDFEASSFMNEEMNLKNFTSNSLKNIGLHLGYPINKKSDSIIRDLHKEINVDIDDKKLNYLGGKYSAPLELTTHEDYVPNTLAFLIVILSFGVIIYHYFLKNKKINKIYIVLPCILVLQIVLFISIFKWQPWHTRLHIPLFIIGSLHLGIALQMSNYFKKIIYLLVPVMIYSFSFYYIYNNLRPIVQNRKYTKSISISDDRFKKYFSNQPYLYEEYLLINNLLYDTNSKKIGLHLGDWEYPIFNSYYYEKIELIAINVNNVTSKIKQNDQNIDSIITNENEEYLLFKGKKYINLSPNNTYIWFYKLSK
ncbi:glycosyltransferase family 39 protein [uncultured Flavobacterium sp.]|uniref:ArnT family glycosyltransferase n=1 Tax=uncultured Flavobacterium sp. TaxID=165435 RepID=UPI0030EC9D65|tara:strand:- start:34755 stop:36665 length:1911 start_codon:yes stop_codon:yes gene_type:complete